MNDYTIKTEARFITLLLSLLGMAARDLKILLVSEQPGIVLYSSQLSQSDCRRTWQGAQVPSCYVIMEDWFWEAGTLRFVHILFLCSLPRQQTPHRLLTQRPEVQVSAVCRCVICLVALPPSLAPVPTAVAASRRTEKWEREVFVKVLSAWCFEPSCSWGRLWAREQKTFANQSLLWKPLQGGRLMEWPSVKHTEKRDGCRPDLVGAG